MKQISNKKYEAYQQYQTDMLYGRILTPDGLRMFSLRISVWWMSVRVISSSGVRSGPMTVCMSACTSFHIIRRQSRRIYKKKIGCNKQKETPESFSASEGGWWHYQD